MRAKGSPAQNPRRSSNPPARRGRTRATWPRSLSRGALETSPDARARQRARRTPGSSAGRTRAGPGSEPPTSPMRAPSQPPNRVVAPTCRDVLPARGPLAGHRPPPLFSVEPAGRWRVRGLPGQTCLGQHFRPKCSVVFAQCCGKAPDITVTSAHNRPRLTDLLRHHGSGPVGREWSSERSANQPLKSIQFQPLGEHDAPKVAREVSQHIVVG